MKLAKTLGLWDIVLFNVTAIIGLRWVSLAAAGGNTSMVLWVAALVFFFLPQAFAVIELTRRLPGEGGVYLWTKETFGDFHGFMSGWCYWTNNLVYFPNLLVYVAGISVFVVGSGYQAVGENKTYVVIFSLAVLWSVMIFNILGLKLGRWVNNVGGIGTWAAGTALILFGIIAVIKFGVANPMPAGSFFHNVITRDKLSFWATICFGFTGLELASVLAGEVKDASRTIPRAVVLAGAAIAAIYVLGTFALLVALPASEINIISGFLQGIAAVADKLGFGWTSNVIALLITFGGIGGVMAWFTGAARMPFVAGVDKYLPAGFGKIHPKYGSPYVAIIVQAVIATFFIITSFVNASVQEAYAILVDTTILVYFIPYVYMFLAYIILRSRDKANDERVALPKNRPLAYLLGLSGLATTVIAMVFALLPASDVKDALTYEIKVGGGFLMFVVAGALIYWIEARKTSKAEHQGGKDIA